ncbi:MAG: hypothetical protein ABFC42_10245 [Sulfuricella sp.]
MNESEELKASRAAYLEKLKKHGAISMPATAHYTAGYNDGSAILEDVANLCEEAERQLIEVTKQRDELLSACETFMSHGVCEVSYYAIRNAIARVKESK